MLPRIAGLMTLTMATVLCGFSAAAQDQKPTAGRVIGELKTMKDSKDGKNTIIEVLAPGEEKARSYFVNFDPKAQAPIASVLKAVRAAKVGDRVELEWVQTKCIAASASRHRRLFAGTASGRARHGSPVWRDSPPRQ